VVRGIDARNLLGKDTIFVLALFVLPWLPYVANFSFYWD